MRLRSAIALVAAIAVVAGGVLGANTAASRPRLGTVQVATASGGTASLTGSWPAPTTSTPAKPKHATSFEVADAIVPRVQLFSSPGVPMPDDQADVPKIGEAALNNPTWEGLDVLFLVKGRKGDWLDVQVSARPNGLRAWIRASDVTIRKVPNWIRIEIGAKRATLLHGDTTLFTAPVVTGRDSAPTPTGVFFVDGVVFLDSDTGPYGIAQMSVSGFSNVYSSFGGGVGQIALHGTNAPSLIGQAVSAGCVRFRNEDLAVFLMQAPTGTPVEILP